MSGGRDVARRDANTPNRPRLVLARERDREALVLRMEGLTFDEIGTRLGVSRESARKSVSRSLDLTRADIAEKAEELRAMEAEKLDAVSAVLWPKVQAGDLRATDRWLRARESYRRLTGIDLMKTTDTGGPSTYIVQAGGDISLVPPSAQAIDLRAPWERPELARGDDEVDGEIVEEES
jgi:DNA-binding CsgD family transcriptional regulator